MARKRLLQPTEPEHPFPWIIISQLVDAHGMPQFDRHTLAEAAQTEQQALVYAEVRAASGYWVTVYREHHYYAPQKET